jgi:uncharacterized membrane protein
MEVLKNTLLVLHVTAGFSSLFTGSLAMILEKGTAKHKRIGQWYFWSMTAVFASAILLAIIGKLIFLFLVGVFSYYLVLSGKQAYKFMRREKQNFWDKALHWVSFAFNLGLIAFGFYLLARNNSFSFATICFVFGGVGLAGSIQNILTLRKEKVTYKVWLKKHIGGMIGGYIATFTAFCVTALAFLPNLVTWLGPTLLFVPVIVYWQRKVDGKRKAKRVAAD